MTERLLGFDPASGLAHWWLQDGEGNWAQRSSQRVDALLDLNRAAQRTAIPTTPHAMCAWWRASR